VRVGAEDTLRPVLGRDAALELLHDALLVVAEDAADGHTSIMRCARDTAVVSQDDVDVVRAMWAAYARGDFEASLALYTEDTVWDDTRYRPDGGVHVGRDALVEVVLTWRAAWEDYEVEAEEALDAGGDQVAVVLRESGRGTGGGVEMTSRWGQVTTVREGRIAHTMVYRTPEEALRASGLQE
jgi:ketosteroid isomerase-like protein